MSVVIPSLRAAIAVPPWVKNGLWRRARAVPSLDLRFADNKSLVDAVTGASLVTFTRASSGTFVDSAGVLQTAATDVPRFDHNPTTGESLGLLVEEQRTNLLLQSNGFDTTWNNTNSSETAAAGTAPDGTNTAWELKDTVDASATTHSIAQGSIAMTEGVTYTYSIFAKAGTLPRVVLILTGAVTFSSGNKSTIFNLTTGITSSPSPGVTAQMVAYPNGWYRCVMTVAADGTGNATATVRIDNGSTPSYQGDGTGTIHLWGADLEAGAFPTSYIPTTTAAVTRSADVASITGSALSSWYRQDEGTVFADISPSQFNGRIYMFDDSTTNERWETRIAAPNSPVFTSWSANVIDVSLNDFVNYGIPTSRLRIASVNKSNSAAHCINGGSVLTDSSSTMPANQSRLFIGSFQGTATYLNGPIRRLAFWPQALPFQLQSLTQ
jgi:hypothetical protein